MSTVWPSPAVTILGSIRSMSLVYSSVSMTHEPNDPFGLLAPIHRAAPYAAFARLREQAPVYYSDAWSCWLVTRYDDVAACFRDDRLSADRAGSYATSLPPEIQQKLAPLIGNLSRWALMKDPPDHTRLRGLASKAFTPRLIAELRPSIEATCDRLLDELDARADAEGGFDLVEGYAFPVPVLVIGAMLGLPPEDATMLKRWSSALTAFLGGASMTQEIVGTALKAVIELEEYFRAQIDARRSEPGDDLLSSLLAAHEHEDRLDEQELLATCTMLLFGGHETTTNLIANGAMVLLRHPEALAWLRDDLEGRIEGAVEELLRFEPPVLRMGRVAREAFELRGETIETGDRLYMVMAAANRDPACFDDPDRLDLARTGNRHLTFGLGRHFCLGAALGRLEGQISLSKLLTRFPSLRLPSDYTPEWIDNLTVRGLARLPLLAG